MLLFLLLACQNHEIVYNCPVTTSVTAPDDTSALGFSADDARALVADDQTLQVEWDSMTYGRTADTFHVTVASAGDPVLAESTEGNVPGACRVGTSMQVPLTLEISALDGGLVETVDGRIDAWSLDELTWGMADYAEVTVEGDFAAEADAAVQAQRADTEVTRWRFVLGGSLTGGLVDLEYEWEDERSQGIAVLLQGTWGDASWE
ncbi:MAG: hypothetical protein Q8P41_10750 [Pseudomonadota bacterium]|nr:hypothetical protein [Pseudomonadota bacterium]